MSQWQGSYAPQAFMSAHPSRGSWPNKELHPRPLWQGLHASPRLTSRKNRLREAFATFHGARPMDLETPSQG
eukprot:3389366-Pyramimonas_sp.AAC.1